MRLQGRLRCGYITMWTRHPYHANEKKSSSGGPVMWTFQPRDGLLAPPLLIRPEKKDMSLSLLMMFESWASGVDALGSLERFASRSCVVLDLCWGVEWDDLPVASSPSRRHSRECHPC